MPISGANSMRRVASVDGRQPLPPRKVLARHHHFRRGRCRRRPHPTSRIRPRRLVGRRLMDAHLLPPPCHTGTSTSSSTRARGVARSAGRTAVRSTRRRPRFSSSFPRHSRLCGIEGSDGAALPAKARCSGPTFLSRSREPEQAHGFSPTSPRRSSRTICRTTESRGSSRDKASRSPARRSATGTGAR